jgi:asparagine synthase (glutamine-hydrolysing)
MFAGYSTFRTVPRMERFVRAWDRMPGAVRSRLANIFAALAPSSDQNRKLTALCRDGRGITHPYFLSRMLFTPKQQDELLPEITRNSEAFVRAEKPLIATLSRAQGPDSVNRVSYLEARCYMLNTLLRDADFMSMAHGLEVRVPLIDHRLARLILALPGSCKMDSGTPKPLLVKALRGQLPRQIVHRRKRGFTLPFEYWLRDALRPVVEEGLLNIGDGVLGTLINARAARDVWQDFLEGRTSWSRPWALYVLQSWCERHSLAG